MIIPAEIVSKIGATMRKPFTNDKSPTEPGEKPSTGRNIINATLTPQAKNPQMMQLTIITPRMTILFNKDSIPTCCKRSMAAFPAFT